MPTNGNTSGIGSSSSDSSSSSEESAKNKVSKKESAGAGNEGRGYGEKYAVKQEVKMLRPFLSEDEEEEEDEDGMPLSSDDENEDATSPLPPEHDGYMYDQEEEEEEKTAAACVSMDVEVHGKSNAYSEEDNDGDDDDSDVIPLLEEEIALHESTIESLNGKLKGLESDIELQRTKIQSHTTNLSTLEVRQTQLRKSRDVNSKLVKDIESNLRKCIDRLRKKLDEGRHGTHDEGTTTTLSFDETRSASLDVEQMQVTINIEHDEKEEQNPQQTVDAGKEVIAISQRDVTHSDHSENPQEEEGDLTKSTNSEPTEPTAVTQNTASTAGATVDRTSSTEVDRVQEAAAETTTTAPEPDQSSSSHITVPSPQVILSSRIKPVHASRTLLEKFWSVRPYFNPNADNSNNTDNKENCNKTNHCSPMYTILPCIESVEHIRQIMKITVYETLALDATCNNDGRHRIWRLRGTCLDIKANVASPFLPPPVTSDDVVDSATAAATTNNDNGSPSSPSGHAASEPVSLSCTGGIDQEEKTNVTSIRPQKERFHTLDSVSHRTMIDPNITICPYELTGTCADETCPYQHLSFKSGRGDDVEDVTSPDSIENVDYKTVGGTVRLGREMRKLPPLNLPPPPISIVMKDKVEMLVEGIQDSGSQSACTDSDDRRGVKRMHREGDHDEKPREQKSRADGKKMKKGYFPEEKEGNGLKREDPLHGDDGSGAGGDVVPDYSESGQMLNDMNADHDGDSVSNQGAIRAEHHFDQSEISTEIENEKKEQDEPWDDDADYIALPLASSVGDGNESSSVLSDEGSENEEDDGMNNDDTEHPLFWWTRSDDLERIRRMNSGDADALEPSALSLTDWLFVYAAFSALPEEDKCARKKESPVPDLSSSMVLKSDGKQRKRRRPRSKHNRKDASKQPEDELQHPVVLQYMNSASNAEQDAVCFLGRIIDCIRLSIHGGRFDLAYSLLEIASTVFRDKPVTGAMRQSAALCSVDKITVGAAAPAPSLANDPYSAIYQTLLQYMESIVEGDFCHNACPKGILEYSFETQLKLAILSDFVRGLHSYSLSDVPSNDAAFVGKSKESFTNDRQSEVSIGGGQEERNDGVHIWLNLLRGCMSTFDPGAGNLDLAEEENSSFVSGKENDGAISAERTAKELKQVGFTVRQEFTHLTGIGGNLWQQPLRLQVRNLLLQSRHEEASRETDRGCLQQQIKCVLQCIRLGYLLSARVPSGSSPQLIVECILEPVWSEIRHFLNNSLSLRSGFRKCEGLQHSSDKTTPLIDPRVFALSIVGPILFSCVSSFLPQIIEREGASFETSKLGKAPSLRSVSGSPSHNASYRHHLDAITYAALTAFDAKLHKIIQHISRLRYRDKGSRLCAVPMVDLLLTPFHGLCSSLSCTFGLYGKAQLRLQSSLSLRSSKSSRLHAQASGPEWVEQQYRSGLLSIYSELLWSQLLQLRMSFPSLSVLDDGTMDELMVHSDRKSESKLDVESIESPSVSTPVSALNKDEKALEFEILPSRIHKYGVQPRHLTLYGDWNLLNAGKFGLELYLERQRQQSANNESRILPTKKETKVMNHVREAFQDLVSSFFGAEAQSSKEEKGRQSTQMGVVETRNKSVNLMLNSVRMTDYSEYCRPAASKEHASLAMISIFPESMFLFRDALTTLHVMRCDLHILPLTFGLYFPNLKVFVDWSLAFAMPDRLSALLGDMAELGQVLGFEFPV